MIYRNTDHKKFQLFAQLDPEQIAKVYPSIQSHA